MNTATLGCQHADPDLVLPLQVVTHKEHTYAVHVACPGDGYGTGYRRLELSLCLVCGQVFVPTDELVEILDAVIAEKQREERVRLAAEQDATQRLEAAKRAADLAANHGIPASRRPK